MRSGSGSVAWIQTQNGKLRGRGWILSFFFLITYFSSKKRTPICYLHILSFIRPSLANILCGSGLIVGYRCFTTFIFLMQAQAATRKNLKRSVLKSDQVEKRQCQFTKSDRVTASIMVGGWLCCTHTLRWFISLSIPYQCQRIDIPNLQRYVYQRDIRFLEYVWMLSFLLRIIMNIGDENIFGLCILHLLNGWFE